MTLGQLHFYGAKGVPRDEILAAQYFQKAAAQGDAGAMTNLGHMHLSGVGVAQNNETALMYFKQAADKVLFCFLRASLSTSITMGQSNITLFLSNMYCFELNCDFYDSCFAGKCVGSQWAWFFASEWHRGQAIIHRGAGLLQKSS